MILVLGGGGMLGHKMFQILDSQFDEVACTILGAKTDEPYRRIPMFQGDKVFERLDATQFQALEVLLRDLRPAVVVNCIGIVKQRPEAKAHIPSITLNSLLPHVLTDICAAWGGKVIHFSTDCVFSGKRGGYTEEDTPDAEDLYGRSKFLGEVTCDNALTLRTSIIGRELKNFRSLLEWFLAQKGKTVRGFTRAIYSGVTTIHLSNLVADILRNHDSLAGLYQVASEPLSKYDLLKLLRDAYELDVEIVPDDEVVCDRSMKADKLRTAIGYVCPSWPKLVAELAADPTPYDEWRKRP